MTKLGVLRSELYRVPAYENMWCVIQRRAGGVMSFRFFDTADEARAAHPDAIDKTKEGDKP